jgi:hypothetical protein
VFSKEEDWLAGGWHRASDWFLFGGFSERCWADFAQGSWTEGCVSRICSPFLGYKGHNLYNFLPWAAEALSSRGFGSSETPCARNFGPWETAQHAVGLMAHCLLSWALSAKRQDANEKTWKGLHRLRKWGLGKGGESSRCSRSSRPSI